MLNPNSPKVIKGSNAKLLNAAVLQDQRHQLHAVSCDGPESASPYWKTVVDKELRKVVPARTKQEQILSKVAWPLVSVLLTDEIQDACGAVHTAQDRSIRVELSTDTLQSDYEQFIEKIRLNDFVAADCGNALFAAPNSFVIVDLATDQTSQFPVPTVYLLASAKVVGAEINTSAERRGQCEWIYFETELTDALGAPLRALFDAEAFSLYRRIPGTGNWVLVRSSPHQLGYCPAFKMWPDVDAANPFVSNTILRPLLGKLDRYPIDDASKEMLDTIGANPIFWHWKTEKCDYKTSDNRSCKHGFIERPTMKDGRVVSTTKERCPIYEACQERSLIGVGTRIPVPAPTSREDADLRPPAGWVQVDVNALTYNRDKVVAVRSEIKSAATGIDGELVKNEAVNADQVLAFLESGRKVLSYLAQHYEVLHKWVLDTIGRLRYGSAYLGSEVSYGRRFTMLSGDQLMTLKDVAKRSGAPGWQLEEIDSLLQTYHARNDASRSLRFQLLTDLNPYPYSTPAELQAASIPLVDPVGFLLSVGLMGYVKRFERENLGIPIERFGLGAEYNTRLTAILERLKQYVNEQNPSTAYKPEPAEGGTNNDRSGH